MSSVFEKLQSEGAFKHSNITNEDIKF